MPEFQSELTFFHDLATVFAFHTRPQNVLTMLPSNVPGELVEGPESLTQGSEFEFRFNVAGVMKQSIRMRVTQFAHEAFLADEQIRGPFKRYAQTHRFSALPKGGTRVEYTCSFEPPGGMLGFVVTETRVMDGLRKLMPYRQQKTRELLDQQFGPVP
jgi:ligand-binding SRPBCC domain-containing protein